MITKKNIIILLIFTVMALIFSGPIYENLSNWGQKDWDQFTMWNAVPHKTILEYHQFPLWNPYVNGGNVMLAHPHAPFLSPFFIFVLIFGPVLGLKIQITLHLIIGLCGMYYLSKHLKINGIAAYFAAFVFMFSSIFPLHLTEGHTEWLAMAFVPWFFLYYLKSLGDVKYVVGGVLFFSLILLNGSVDVFNIMVVFLSIYALIKSIQLRQFIAVKVLALIFIGTFVLCAIKLLPMLEFLNQFPRLTDENSGVSWRIVYHMLLDHDQEVLDVMGWRERYDMGLEYDWHEYGAYIGIIPLIFCFVGVFKIFRTHWPLVMTGIICFVIALGSGSPINLWWVLHSLPYFDSLTVPSRFILGFILMAAFAAGIGFQYLEEYIKQKSGSKRFLRNAAVPLAVLTFVLLDLCQSNGPIFENAFTLKPKILNREVIFGQRYKSVQFYMKHLVNSSIYPVFLSHSGVLDAYEVVQVRQGDIKVMGQPGYKGEFYLDAPKGEATLLSFSPNKLVYDVNLASSNLLVINQNYHNGWKVLVDGESSIVHSTNGLLSVHLPVGQYTVVLYYLPNSFIIGLLVTSGFILLGVIALLKRKTFVLSNKDDRVISGK